MAQDPTKTYDYAIANAFTRSPFGGNPAVIIFLDAPLKDDDEYYGITRNFNHPPIACFVWPDASAPQEPDMASFHIRYFVPEREPPLCGHGTLATTHALLARPELVPPHVRLLRFATKHGHIIYAKRVPGPVPVPESDVQVASERIELELPAFNVVPVDAAEFVRLKNVVTRALGNEDAVVNFIGIAASGESGSELYILIELGDIDLTAAVIDPTILMETKPYVINVVTAASSKPGVAYETRMFAPHTGIPEDHACGSSHCLMAPYWSNKLGIASKEEMAVKHVSKRGGDMVAIFDEERKRVRLQGEARLFSEGKIFV
ncbi:hypothetical protein M0805_009250 [Coniferiporia weirii]|nr:hypothetical protein M0805_009250 [Coniferiporia weirii]